MLRIENNGERYGQSIFWKYQGKIYALITGEGALPLENVDIESFRILDDIEYQNNVGTDKEKVYFGNEIIPDLNPEKIYSVGNGYYSDGRIHYFCPAFREDWKARVIWEKIWRKVWYEKEAQIYPYKKIDSKKLLQPIENLQYFASDGEKVFYRGKSLEKANPEKMKEIGECARYFTDEVHVYYQSALLPISYHNGLKSFSRDHRDYLLDGRTGNIFLGTISLEESYAPYQVLGEKSEHNHTLFFVSKEGIFVYDEKHQKQKKIGENGNHS